MEPRSWDYGGVTVTVTGAGMQGYHDVVVDDGDDRYRFTFQQYAARPTGTGDRIVRNGAPGLQVACAVERDGAFVPDEEETVVSGRETVTVYNTDLRDLSESKLEQAHTEIDAYIADTAADQVREAVNRFFHDIRARGLLD